MRAIGLRKTYGERVALDDVSFELAPGTVTVIAGANGAGKSTLLRCLAGTVPHDGDVETPQPVAYLPQQVNLPEVATAAEVVELFRGIAGAPRASGSDWLGALAPRRVGTLSGGERRRVALAALFEIRPRTVLLDEPTAELDDAALTGLRERLRAMADAGATVVVTTPALGASALASVADRTIVIERGRVVDAP